MALFWCKEVKMTEIPEHMYIVQWDGIRERFRAENKAVQRYRQVSLLDKRATITKLW